MNKQPATLLRQSFYYQPPDYGINGVLDKYVLRPGQPYFSGASIMESATGPYGVPYWMTGLAMQTCNNQYITAPTPWQKDLQFHTVGGLYTAGQYGNGGAPTKGVFTGVEDCS